MKRSSIFVAVALLLATAAVASTAFRPRVPELGGTLLDPPLEAVDFTLQGEHGELSTRDLRGRFTVLSFGYTSCPDVCPATLARLVRVMDLLGPLAEEVDVVFVSVDPERDTPAVSSEYVRRFDPTFFGVSGSPEAVGEVAAGYGIYHAKGPVSNSGGYLVDHTATTTVLDREGRRVLLWPYGLDSRRMADDLRYLLRR